MANTRENGEIMSECREQKRGTTKYELDCSLYADGAILFFNSRDDLLKGCQLSLCTSPNRRTNEAHWHRSNAIKDLFNLHSTAQTTLLWCRYLEESNQVKLLITNYAFCIVQRATKQSKTGIFRDSGVAEAPPGFQAGWSDCMHSFSLFLFILFAHLELIQPRHSSPWDDQVKSSQVTYHQ
jgi:hypothetical protein